MIVEVSIYSPKSIPPGICKNRFMLEISFLNNIYIEDPSRRWKFSELRNLYDNFPIFIECSSINLDLTLSHITKHVPVDGRLVFAASFRVPAP
jgi:hypothetical protein